MVNGLSVALLMWSLALCNQVLSELRRVHFTGSQGTCSNQNAVVPPVCNKNTITFHHRCAFIHSWRKAGTGGRNKVHRQKIKSERDYWTRSLFFSAFSFRLLMSASLRSDAIFATLLSMKYDIWTCFSAAVGLVFFQTILYTGQLNTSHEM